MPDLLTLAIREHRAAVTAIDRAALARIYAAYQQAVDRLQPGIELLQQQALAEGALTPAQVFRLERYRELQRQLTDEMARLAEITGDATRGAQASAIQEAITAAERLAVASAVGQFDAAVIAGTWTRVPFLALEDLIGATQSGPLADLLGTFEEKVQTEVVKQLTDGMALGKSPRAVADAIAKATKIGETRALTIARTETLRAYRSATLRTYDANADVLKGWVWTAAHQARTCGACLAMDNSEHPLSEPFASHVCCRCSPRPLLRNVAMRPVENGEEWLRKQDAATQEDKIGRASCRERV